jgi:hypothetical protein
MREQRREQARAETERREPRGARRSCAAQEPDPEIRGLACTNGTEQQQGIQIDMWVEKRECRGSRQRQSKRRPLIDLARNELPRAQRIAQPMIGDIAAYGFDGISRRRSTRRALQAISCYATAP